MVGAINYHLPHRQTERYSNSKVTGLINRGIVRMTYNALLVEKGIELCKH